VLKTTLIVLNIVVGVGLLGVIVAASLVKSRRRVAPANLTPHYHDAVLENQHLSRVLGFALITTAFVAIALPVYWLLVPLIQERHSDAFLERSIHVGDTEFHNTAQADPEILHRQGVVALDCARCHGSDGSGGSATYLYNDPVTNKNYSLAWTAPALNTVYYRFPREQIKTIITYGRKGTPMPAWGLDGGGPVNDQGIEDLLNYIESIQLSPEAMQKQLQDQIDAQRKENPDASDGQILFEVNCARCHTQGWSFHTTYAAAPGPGGTGGAGQPLPMIPGDGAYGPSLTNGRVERQFPDPKAQFDFISAGSKFQAGYGVRGIGSGGMPGFARNCDAGQVLQARDCRILTDDQINQIVAYERGLQEPEQGAQG
jgi:mono/diheme cytochrome c family protein